MTPALLLLLGAVAHAFDVLKTDALLPRVEEVAARAGGPIVVGAAGGESEQTLRRLLRARPELPCVLERAPLMGEAEADMQRLLQRAGYACGLRVAPGGADGEWIVSEHGACGQDPAAATANGWLPAEPPAARSSGRRTRREESVERPAEALDPTRLLLLEQTVPDPTTALLSSFLVGFGSGHFYARDHRMGWLYAGLQAGGLALYGLGRFAGASALDEEDAETARLIGALGLGFSVGVRLVDAGTAPAAAHTEARRQIERNIP